MKTADDARSERAPSGRRTALPQGSGYSVKRALLGPALPTANLEHERLGKPTALAVFASDNLSSVAYATEEILKVAVLAGIGAAAFTLVMPITIGILAVLGILLFSYRQTIKAYPSAGGAYIVTKDNFGLLPAQIAGVALLTDYVLTVSVSVAAGIAAVTSAAPGLYPYRVWMSVFCIWFIAWGNLRGVRESGTDVRRPHVLLHLHDVPDARDRALPCSSRAASTRSPSRPTSRSCDRRRHPLHHPERVRVRRRRRDRGRGRSRTASRRSNPSSGRTPGRR